MLARLQRLLPPPGYRRRYVALSSIDAFGTGMFIPVSVLFLTRIVGISAVDVGIGLTIAGIGSLITEPVAGALGDRYDARLVAAAGYAVCATGFAAYAFVGSFAWFVVLASVIGVFERLASSARTLVALTIATESADRVTFLAYERSTRNLGYGLGGLLASLALISDTRPAYAAVLLVNAVTFAAGAAIVLRLPRARPLPAAAEAGGYREVLRDRPYVALAVMTALMWLDDTLLRVGLPLWIVRRTDVSPSATGVYFALNTALIVGLQVRTSAGAADARGAARAYRLAALALVATCGLFAAAAATETIVTVCVLTLSIVALTLAELYLSAAQWGASIGLVREEMRGRYLGVFSTAIGVQRAFGPLIVTFALVRGGGWGWLGLAVFFLVAGDGARRVALREADRRDLRTALAQAEPA